MRPPARTIAIIQARMGSQRLPGKSMALLAGKPLLWHVIERVKRCRTLDAIVLATTKLPQDDVLIELAKSCGIETFRGSEKDLVDRFYKAALAFRAELIVRICADNPVLQATEIDRIVTFHQKNNFDFSSNLYEIQDNGYPDGLGAEVFSIASLKKVWDLAKDPQHREHPHLYFYDHPEIFKIGTVACPAEFRRPDLKLDVNTPAELAYLRQIYDYWYPKKAHFDIVDIIWWYDQLFHASKHSESR